MRTEHKVMIREAYKDYEPPTDVRRVVEELLDGVPPEHLRGLRTVVLTNVANLNHNERRGKITVKGRKVRLRDVGGCYHHKTRRESAWIQILVDNCLRQYPDYVLAIPSVREAAILHVLYHEIGHHIHATHAREHREPEAVAEKWRKELCRCHYREKHPWVAALAAGARPLVRGCRRTRGAKHSEAA